MYPLWLGYLYFELASISIKLHRAIKEKEIEFHLFHEENKGKENKSNKNH